MKKKDLYLTLLFLFCSFSLFAQNKQISYHAADGKTVETREASYYYRIITTDDQHHDHLKYREYYTKDDRLKLATHLTNGSMTGSRIGECRTYYPNGQLQTKTHYDANHRLTDTSYTYYRNGNLYTIQLHKEIPAAQSDSTLSSTAHDELRTKRVVEHILVKDSLGNVLIENGTGILPVFELTNFVVLEQGPLLNNKKDGEWVGKANKRTFKEIWKEDRLINGLIKDSLGLETKYDEKNFAIDPEYPGGILALRTFVANNYQYPSAAVREGVSGTIQLEFIVESDGSMSSFQVKKDLGHGTGQAAINAIRKAEKQWSLGVQRGIPVRVAYTLPINPNLM